MFDLWYGPGVLTDPPVVRVKEVEDDQYRLVRIARPVMYDERNIVDVNYEVLIIDKKTNTILYGKNEKQKRKMASTTKIMTATIIIENCNLDETIEISKKAAGTGGSRLGLKTGDKITIRDLLYGLMMRSGNDAAVALAEYCRWKH